MNAVSLSQQRGAPKYVPPPGARTTGGAGADVQPLTATVVEDEVFVALTIEDSLVELGYVVHDICSSGGAAIAAVRRRRPDILLMDINLAGAIDGIEAARRIREQFSLPVLFISAYGDADTRARIADAVPDAALLSKPFSAGDLARAIAALMPETH